MPATTFNLADLFEAAVDEWPDRDYIVDDRTRRRWDYRGELPTVLDRDLQPRLAGPLADFPGLAPADVEVARGPRPLVIQRLPDPPARDFRLRHLRHLRSP